PGAPLNRDDSAEVIKIPDPIIEPITIIVASIGPSTRTRLDCCGDGPPSGRIGPAFRREGAPAPFSGHSCSISISNHVLSRDTAMLRPSRQAQPESRFVQRNAIFLNSFRWIADTNQSIPLAR